MYSPYGALTSKSRRVRASQATLTIKRIFLDTKERFRSSSVTDAVGTLYAALSGPLLFKAHLGRDHGNISQPVQTRIVEGGWLRHYVGRKICQGIVN
jgi:hypothetical protein